ncbi:MAG TPA: glutathione S-transferase family protein [Reyranella sp.]|nr:glutathione S-transferase family protein [Reyranella sp.]
MKLYSLKGAPNPRRVRIFLAEKKARVPVEELELEAGTHRQPEFLQRNPLGLLPVLELDTGETISESIAICRYFDELMPEPPLFGRSSRERVDVEMWTRHMEHELLLPVIDVFIHTHPLWAGRRPQIAAYGDLRHGLLVERLKWLDGVLKDREFIAADRYTVADITAQVAVLTGRAVAKLVIPEDHKNLARWWGAVSKRPTARA